MKRTRLRRLTPLRRGSSGLRRKTPLPGSQAPILRRTRLAPISERRRDVNAERARRQVEAWGPRPWPCAMRSQVGEYLTVETREGVVGYRAKIPPCRGAVNGHEILSRARAGRTDANLLDVTNQRPLCNGHNGWLTKFYAVSGWSEHSWRLAAEPGGR